MFVERWTGVEERDSAQEEGGAQEEGIGGLSTVRSVPVRSGGGRRGLEGPRRTACGVDDKIPDRVGIRVKDESHIGG